MAIKKIIEEVKKVEEIKPKERVFSESEKEFMRLNNYDEYLRTFGKPK